MKNFISLVLLVITTIPSLAFEVVELPLKNSDKIVVKLMFLNGSVCDPKGKEGLTNLTASLVMNGGTGTLTSTQIKDKTYPWASRWYASVDKEVTIFTFEFHKDHINDFFPVLAGLVTNPLMDPSDFNRLKSNQLNYVNEVIRASSDEEFSKMGLEDLYFRGTPYQHMVNGTSSGVEAITLDDVKMHYKSFFTIHNITIGLAGNYSEDFKNELLGAMKKLSNEAVNIPPMRNPLEPKGIEVEIISKEKAGGSAIFTGSPLPITRRDIDFAALMVANSWLGEHRKSYSRLYQKIREQRSMNYGDYSYIEWYENGGSNMLPQPGYPRNTNYFSLWIRPVQTAEALKQQYPELDTITVGHAHFALRMAIRELNNLVKNGMTAEDFELTRNFLRSYMKLYIQTPAKQLGFLMDSKFYGRENYIAEMDELLSKLSVEKVNYAIKKYWENKPMYICIVTDDSEAEPLKQSLLNNTSSPMSYSNALRESMSDKILKEDEEVSGYMLKVTKVEIVSVKDKFR